MNLLHRTKLWVEKLSIIIFDYVQVCSEKLSILYMSQASNIYLIFILPLICVLLSLYVRPLSQRSYSLLLNPTHSDKED